ncbi:MAG: aminoacyl-histidine dipeptidase [Bacteroidetes bacterium]|nr:MAG: aminoacyl-histidine dipeptidase [Bacteroidota bacterium]
MGKVLGHLQPQRVWELFEEICGIPRPSKKEEKIIGWLIDFAKKNKLDYRRDRVGNIVISKPASPGYEKKKMLVLQGHVDMVCEKNADVTHDFDKDPIQPFIDGDWVKAKGTTLGADNGIGMAFQLAILEDKDLKHGPLECLFTVDEETGLTGAFGLEPGFLKGRMLLNLDSEDDTELCIGCAGGLDTLATFNYERVNNETDHIAFKVSVSGLKGGHSGDDINKGRGNANKILARILWNCERMFEMRLAQIDGGNLRNAIAREAFAILTIPRKFKKDLEETIRQYAKDVAEEQKSNEPGVKINLHETAKPECLIDYSTQSRLLGALYGAPHGVLGMSADIPGLVETSTNLASVKMTSKNILVASSQRSSVASLKKDAADMVSSVFQLAGAKVSHGDGYPGWTPNMKSEILYVMRTKYKELFGEEPNVLAIHAGLECGLIGEKYPGMDMISFGPKMKGVHSPDEKLSIPSVEKSWKFVLEVLKNIPEE